MARRNEAIDHQKTDDTYHKRPPIPRLRNEDGLHIASGCPGENDYWNNQAGCAGQLSQNHPHHGGSQRVIRAWRFVEYIPKECLLNEAALVASNACDCEDEESEGNFPVPPQGLPSSCKHREREEERRETQQNTRLNDARRKQPNNHSISKACG